MNFDPPPLPGLPLTATAATSPTLPGWAYTDPAVFAREREAIHFRSWHYAGTTQELSKPGDYLTAQILDQNIIVIRGKDGALRGFYNVCQHRGHELLRGRGRVNAITCPYHAWTYGLDGGLNSARGTAELPDFKRAAFNLKPVRVEVFVGKLIFFNLDADARPLIEQAADLAEDLMREIPSFERLTVAPGVATAQIRANWKVTVDNYLECYHCRVAHPALSGLIDLASFRVDVRGYWMSHKAMIGRYDNAAYPVATDAANKRTLWWWLWPTTTFNVMPGSAELSVFSFLPTAIDSTLQWGQRFALPGDAVDEARERYRNGPLTDEDVAIVESVQRGLHSRGYSAGRFVDSAEGLEISERATHHFHRLVAQALDATAE
jgi:phenylpropionate dioxygenase-like ring-hydroxylating dioxygenase large terminal subunit